MQIIFFQQSLHQAAEHRSRQIRDYVKQMPESDFDAADREQMCELIAARYRFPEMPEFATTQIEFDEPTFTQNSSQARVRVYFPYKGDVSLFGLYHNSKPGYPPPPVFEIGQGTLIKEYALEKHELGSIDQKVDAEIKLVEQYTKSVRDMIPKFNEQLLAVAKENFDGRVHELNQNKQAAAQLAQSRLKLRKRQDGAENVIVPLQRKQIAVSTALSLRPVWGPAL